jgi:hypothetical protein
VAVDVSRPDARIARFGEFMSRRSWVVIPLMAVGYAVWQPMLQWLLHLTTGDDYPFQTNPQWRMFIAAMLVVGAIAGLVFNYARRQKPGAWRQWLDLLVFFGATVPLTAARHFAETPFVFSIATIIVSVLLAATLLVYPVVWFKRALGVAQGRAPSA